MTWPAEFVDALAADAITPVFVLRSVSMGVPWERSFTWSSHPVVGAEVVLTSPPRIQWGMLSPLACRMSYSSLQADLLGTVDRVGIMRGQVVELLVGEPGTTLAGMTPVWVGVLSQMSMDASRRWLVQCQGLEGALWSRWWEPPGFDIDDPSMMPYAGAATTLAADYTSGDTTVTVSDSTTALNASKPANGVYAFRVSPTGGTPFVLLATGASGSDFTGCTTGLDSSPVDAVAGDVVEVLSYAEDHPIDMFGNLVLASGPSDSYPVAWSLRLPASLVDTDDMAAQKVAAERGFTWSSPSWVLSVDAPIPEGTAWLHGMLGDAACFATQRQGQLTARALVEPDDLEPIRHATDRDVVAITYQAFGPEQVEHRGVEVRDRAARPTPADPTSLGNAALDSFYAMMGHLFGFNPPASLAADLTAGVTQFASAGNEPPASMPGRGFFRRALPVYGTTLDRANWRTTVALRTLPYATRVGEVVTVTTKGMAWAGVAAGDGVTLDLPSQVVESRRGPGDELFSGGRAWLVLGGGPDWASHTCTHTLLGVPPDDED